jgi:hypothetical protein
MKKIILGLGLLTVSSLFLNSCEKVKEEEKTIQGKWNVDKSVVLGQTILGTGSYLKFGTCNDTTCIGEDYSSTNSTKGAFTYSLNSEQTQLVIIDETSDGGAWGGTWTITKFTEDKLTLKTTTFLGEVSFELSK